MKKSLVLAMAMALGVTASAYAANPFSDVPAGHWAYDSVAKLAAAGVVDGYADGAFAGDKLITRYEMAQIVAKAMAKGADCDKLAAEFADELDTLGVRVAKLEKGADAVKITGEIRWHYADNDTDLVNSTTGKKYGVEHKLRSRLWFAGKVNEDWTYTAMFENNQDFTNDIGEETVSFQRAYLDGKVGGLKVRAGRYHKSLGYKAVLDHRFDGVEATYGKEVKLTAGFGEENSKKYSNVAYAELGTKVGIVDALVGYYSFHDAEHGTDATATTPKDTSDAEDKEIWAIGATMPVAKDVKLSAIYFDSDAEKSTEDEGFQVNLKYKGAKASAPGSWGMEAIWYDLGDGVYVDHNNNGLEGAYCKNAEGGFKGYSLQANYALAKNIVAQVEWYDVESKKTKNDSETLWTQVVFTF